MKRYRIVTLMVLATAGMGTVWSATHQARGTSPDHLPQAVLEAIQRAYPAAIVSGSRHGRISFPVYDVVVQNGGKRIDLQVAKDGTIVGTEQLVTWNELPAAVAQTLGQAAGSTRVDEIDRMDRHAKLALVGLREPKSVFEAEWERDGREIEVGIHSDGTLVTSDDDGEDDDEAWDRDEDGDEDEDEYGDDGR